MLADYIIESECGQLSAEFRVAAYDEGEADGAFGYKPRFINDQYLRGWLAGTTEILKTYPCDRQGRIQYPRDTSLNDPLQWLWEAGEDLRERWGLPKLNTELAPDSEV